MNSLKIKKDKQNLDITKLEEGYLLYISNSHNESQIVIKYEDISKIRDFLLEQLEQKK